MTAEMVLILMEELGSMKNIRRTGWSLKGIRDGESIADHCYRTAILAMLIADILEEEGMDINPDKVTRIALLHEIAEARIGDIPYPALRHIPQEVKATAELDAIESMLKGFGPLRQKYVDLWSEFEYGTSMEGLIVHIADKLELMIQVSEYEKLGYTDFNEFWTTQWNQSGIYETSLTAEIMEILKERHNKRGNNELGKTAS